MSGDAQWTLQKAVYAALTTALAPTKVYDYVPQDSVFPYCVIGETEASEFDTDTERGQEHRFMVHVWDNKKRGSRSIKDLQLKIRDALDAVALSLESGAALVFCYYEFSSVFIEPDGLTYHGVTRFRAVTTEA